MGSFYDANVRLVADSRKVDPADKDLLAAFMTIEDLTDLLHDPGMNAIRDIGEKYIIDVLVDVKKIINSLRKYRGNKTIGTREAKESMDKVSEFLYHAQTAVQTGNPDKMAVDIVAGGNELDKALSCLQQWESLAQEIRTSSNNRPPQGV